VITLYSAMSIIAAAKQGNIRCYLCLDEVLLPGENGDGIVPNRSDYDAGKTREPPDLLPRKDTAGDADICNRA
jgi:hypothetical protein